ncbi:unnamed protein product [Durusdinium trenchii]|uniref:Uncharacterized protein n=1 Tax=Durusdinium trenchii TaxID=1381693 RepID=A0ABP0QDD3_9DINO
MRAWRLCCGQRSSPDWSNDKRSRDSALFKRNLPPWKSPTSSCDRTTLSLALRTIMLSRRTCGLVFRAGWFIQMHLSGTSCWPYSHLSLPGPVKSFLVEKWKKRPSLVGWRPSLLKTGLLIFTRSQHLTTVGGFGKNSWQNQRQNQRTFRPSWTSRLFDVH